MSQKALDGLRVLELGQHVAVPYCTRLLADLGADVIKVERPGGDPLRQWGPFPGDTPDPEKATLFHVLNRNKRGLVLDLAQPSARDRVLALTAEADLVVDGLRPGKLDEWGLDAPAFENANPQLARVQVSGFGQAGPYRDWPALDLVIQAAGAWVSGHGVPDSKPMRVGGRLPEFLAGSYAATASLAAVLSARQQGRAAYVDLSMMECLVGSLPYPMVHRHALESLGLPAPEVRYNPLPGILRCRDGWIGVNALTPPQWELACILLDVPEFVDRLDEVGDSHEAYREFIEATQPWLAQQDVATVAAKARELRIPVTPIGNGQSLLDSEQLRARDFFVEGALGGYEEPGFPYRMSGTPLTRRHPAPRLDSPDTEITWEPRDASPLGVELGSAPHKDRPLEGLRVLDLGAFWAAPYAGMYLAGLGAEVTKIESPTRPDAFRFIASSLEAGEFWYECGPLFQATNLGKQGLTLDLSREEGRDLLRQLVAESDVVLENFSPRVMENWGFDDAGLRAIRPDLVVVRTPGFGLEGPWRDALGWALVIEQAAGMSWLVGDPKDNPPRNPGGFFDPAVGMHLSLAIQAALAHRRRTGEGQCIEIAQLELGASMMAESVIDCSLNGRVQQRAGNRARDFAPQGVYAGSDDEWVAITAPGPEQWEALIETLGTPAWTQDAQYQTAEGRFAASESLDERLAAEIRQHAATPLAEQLRAAGVPAATVLVSSGMYADPQLVARGYFQALDHPVSGERRYPTWPMDSSFLPRAVHRSMAPTLGQHNESILSERLGLSQESIAELREKGIIAERLATP